MKWYEIFNNEKRLILCQSLNVNKLGGPGTCSLGEILKPESSEIAGKVHFCIY